MLLFPNRSMSNMRSVNPLCPRSSHKLPLRSWAIEDCYIWRIPSMYLRDEELKKQLSEMEDLTEQKIDWVLNLFLEDLKSEKGMEKWPLKMPAYSTSKATSPLLKGPRT